MQPHDDNLKEILARCFDGQASFPLSATEDATIDWMNVYLGCVVAFNVIQLLTLIDQYRILSDEKRCRDLFDNKFPQVVRDHFKYEKVEESNAYQKVIFKFLIVRTIFATLPFDFAVMYYRFPAYLWYATIQHADELGFCGDESSNSGHEA